MRIVRSFLLGVAGLALAVGLTLAVYVTSARPLVDPVVAAPVPAGPDRAAGTADSVAEPVGAPLEQPRRPRTGPFRAGPVTVPGRFRLGPIRIRRLRLGAVRRIEQLGTGKLQLRPRRLIVRPPTNS
jgi:hypothetical protein